MAQTQVLTNPALVLLDGSTKPPTTGGKLTTDHASILADDAVKELLVKLRQRGIQVHETDGVSFPTGAAMHNRAATVPAIVVSPRSEWGVSQTLSLLKAAGLHGRVPVSVRSGGHGYFNGATCAGIMLNLADMTRRRVDGDANIMALEPGCVLGQTIHALAAHGKAVPHGDCFGVGAGGHFLTAGWDLILGRRHGLGCQSVVGGRVVLWDGSVLDVDEDRGAHPDLLFAVRGGAAAGAGVVVETRLRLVEEPPLATWRFTRVTRAQLKDVCVAQGVFTRAYDLPREVSVSFRFHFEPDQTASVASFNIVSLLPARDTVELVRKHMGNEVAALVGGDGLDKWQEKSLVDLRMLPASDYLAANPAMAGRGDGGGPARQPAAVLEGDVERARDGQLVLHQRLGLGRPRVRGRPAGPVRQVRHGPGHPRPPSHVRSSSRAEGASRSCRRGVACRSAGPWRGSCCTGTRPRTRSGRAGLRMACWASSGPMPTGACRGLIGATSGWRRRLATRSWTGLRSCMTGAEGV